MSPRAAWRLETLGFKQVFDYVAGKADWLASGLPIEGTEADSPRAGDVARRDVPICLLDERLDEIQERVREAGWDTCIVVNDKNVVLGRMRLKQLGSDPATAVEEAMQSGPSTVRPDTGLEALLRRMRDRNLSDFLITTADGKLVGLLRREDAERRLGEGAA